MTRKAKKEELEAYLNRFEAKLPQAVSDTMHWIRQPTLIWYRALLAAVLIVTGLFGFLPIFGFWMIPLGLLLVAQDVPFLQGPLVAVFRWVERRWRKL